VVGTVTVIGILSSFCAILRFSAVMAPSRNEILTHGCLVFHVVPELPNRSSSFSITAAGNQMLLTA